MPRSFWYSATRWSLPLAAGLLFGCSEGNATLGDDLGGPFSADAKGDLSTSSAPADMTTTPAPPTPTPAPPTPTPSVAPQATPGFDFDGDGYDDLAVTGFDGAGLASVLVYRGGPSGPALTPSFVIPGLGASGGWAIVVNAGDLDGDDLSDLVVRTGVLDGTTLTTPSTVLYVIKGGTTTVSQVLTGPAMFGGDQSTAGAGDVNGDGFADLIVGSMGHAQLYLGGPTGLSPTPAVTLDGEDPTGADQFGDSAAGAGDVDGDGFADVVVGAYAADQGQGRAYVYLGGAGGLSPHYATRWLGIGSSLGSFGRAVATAGDVNGDGISDVLIGAPGNAGIRAGTKKVDGSFYVFYGSASGLRATPDNTIHWPSFTPAINGFGFAGVVAAAGDIDGDGFGDVLVLMPGSLAQGGEAAEIYFGAAAGLSAAHNRILWEPWSPSLSSGGDLDGDGHADIVIGDPANSAPTGDFGKVNVVSGGRPTTPALQLGPPTGLVNFGASVAE